MSILRSSKRPSAVASGANSLDALDTGTQSGCCDRRGSPRQNPCSEHLLAPQQSQSVWQRPAPRCPCRRLQRQYVYFCTRKTSKLSSTCDSWMKKGAAFAHVLPFGACSSKPPFSTTVSSSPRPQSCCEPVSRPWRQPRVSVSICAFVPAAASVFVLLYSPTWSRSSTSASSATSDCCSQHASAYSAYVSIRQHTSAYVDERIERHIRLLQEPSYVSAFVLTY